MDTEALVSDKYNVGMQLITIMDTKGLSYPVIFWMRQDERNDWALVFGVPKVRSTGAKKVYKKINDIIIINALEISIADIKIIDTRDYLIRMLKAMIRTEMPLVKINFINNYHNGTRFPDSILYRVT